MKQAKEVNFDGLVGPTHNYSGLSYGNVASLKSKEAISNPKEAALQGLEKMKYLHDLGLPQVVLPPHLRPHMPTLHDLGFKGSDKEVLSRVFKTAPDLLYNVSSAAAMWTANAATISPSSDTLDQKVHITPANLTSKFHRSIEASFTEKILKRIFNDETFFKVHSPLKENNYLADEGAANHNRLCEHFDDKGLELFVYGKSSLDSQQQPQRYPARQTLEASQAISRNHLLSSDHLFFAQQNPEAIDAGVFHNDVISVANKNVFFCHEKAFVNTNELIQNLQKKLPSLIPILLSESRISLSEVVNSYLFNSQLISLPDSTMQLILPYECSENKKIANLLEEIVADPLNPIQSTKFFNLHQSMKNGGGPACLRLRVVLTDRELKNMHQGVILTPTLYNQLKEWIHKYYRDRLKPTDLADPLLLLEVQEAYDKISHILDLKNIYS